MPANMIAAAVLCWADEFRRGELTVEDVQDRFASIDESDVTDLPSDSRTGLMRARQELDAIRYGMCESGQRGEMQRIFGELEALLAQAGHQ